MGAAEPRYRPIIAGQNMFVNCHLTQYMAQLCHNVGNESEEGSGNCELS